MGGSASDTLKQAGGGVLGSSVGAAAMGPGGAILGGLAGSDLAQGASFGSTFNNLMPKDPFGSGAAQDRRRQAIEDIKNQQVTRDQTQTGTIENVGETTTELAAKSQTQEQLESASLANFLEQQKLVKAQEQALAGRADLQTAGRDVLGDIAGGEAFGLTSDEQARINALRQSEIDVGSQAVNQLLDQRLGELQANLAQRGVRGQAASQLQADTLGEATQSLERRILAANQNAAQQALAMPGQRVGIQAQVGQGLADFQEQARQQAIVNRQQLQDPSLLRALREDRLAQATKRTSDTQTQDLSTSSVSQGEGAASAIAQLATQPTRQQQDVATAGGLIGSIGKGVGGLLGGMG